MLTIIKVDKGDMFYMRKEVKENHTSTNTNHQWGLLSCIDLYNCDPQTIRNDKRIKEFVVQLCDLIEMKRFGETQVVYFGEEERVAGYSMTQLIETSLISAHFANNSNTTYLDVFSCKPYDSQAVVDFAKKFFKAERVNLQVVKRE